MVIADAPGAGPQCNLEEGVAVQQDHNGHQQTQGKGKVGGRLVRLVEGVRLGELCLVVHQFLLLLQRQDGKLGFLGLLGLGVGIFHDFGGKIVVVVQGWQRLFPPESPGQVVVVSDVAHVICVDHSEWSQPVTDNGKKRDQDIVDDVDDVQLLISDRDPT